MGQRLNNRLKTGLTILFLVSFFANKNAMAQGVDCPNFKAKEQCGDNEIGINLYNILNLKPNTSSRIYQNVFNGLMYKRHCRKNALRISVDFFHYNYSYYVKPGGGYPWYSKDDSKTLIGELRLGYEHSFTLKKLRPFIALDALVQYGQTIGKSEGLGDFPPYEGWNSNYTYRFIKYGVAPAIGLKYRPIYRLSFTVELNLNIVYSSASQNFYKGINIYFNPLRLLSVNYHFRKK
jgi:hypothetical protein